MKTQGFIVTNKKKVLLTGGSRGIGRAIFDELSHDYELITPSRKDLDLSCPSSIDHFFSHNHLEIDILINNAGINIIKELNIIEDCDIDQITAINLISPLKLIQNVLPYMKQRQQGKIVNVSSIWGIRSKEKRSLYSMTKFGIIGQTKALARELGEHNILVNTICPGFTATDLTMQSLSEEEVLSITNEIPLQRMAQPSEIAKSVRFLISDDNTYMTGQTLVVDGGFTA